MKKTIIVMMCLCVVVYATQTDNFISSAKEQKGFGFRNQIQSLPDYSGCNCKKPVTATRKSQLMIFDHDVGCVAIISPHPPPHFPGDYDVIALFRNYGSFTETFDVTATVYDTVGMVPIFSQTVTVVDLQPANDTVVNFGTVTFGTVGYYYVEIYTQLIGDENPSNNVCPYLQLGDVIFELDVETITGDNRLQGTEFDGSYFYLTGASDLTQPKVYVIDTTGNLIASMNQPAHVTGWGWFDLAWDDVYSGPDRIDTLYAGFYMNIDMFSIVNDTLIYYFYAYAPFYCKSLAYKPDSMWFYTAYGDSVYKFKKYETFIQGAPNPGYYIQGAAYDTDPTDGGWIWWHSADDPGTGFMCQIEQMDAITMDFTGLNFGYIPTITPTGVAGGLCFYEGFRGVDALYALVRGDPDAIVGIFVRYDVGIAEEQNTPTPRSFGFAHNITNPAWCRAAISYTTTIPGKICLKIYDNTGRLIRALVDHPNEPAGTKTVFWDGKDDNLRSVANGIYFLRLDTAEKSATQKLILIK
ncbi:T9SS type A sorting domain-containing protein [candidate division WOR-3 bacterium]|nr:T9SS type A sorting domain-containing protein [candidate division WOR-3 bacterium]